MVAGPWPPPVRPGRSPALPGCLRSQARRSFMLRLIALIAATAATAGGQVLPLPSPVPKSGGMFGGNVSGVPDVDGDGGGDLVVGGVAQAQPGGGNAGRGHGS